MNHPEFTPDEYLNLFKQNLLTCTKGNCNALFSSNKELLKHQKFNHEIFSFYQILDENLDEVEKKFKSSVTVVKNSE